MDTKPQTKICTIVKTARCYCLLVDSCDITFYGEHALTYFYNHYKDLGYKVETRDESGKTK